MKPLSEALIAGLRRRFDCALLSEEHKVATMLHPKFKLAFLQGRRQRGGGHGCMSPPRHRRSIFCHDPVGVV